MMDHVIHTNGISLHYLDHAGDGPTLVLLPGLTANAHAFDGLLQAGLSSHFRVLALDLRGRGATDAPATGYTMADHAADVIGLLDALNIERVILAGHSFGGMLTLYIAAQYPERVAELIVIDAALAVASPTTRAQIQPALDRLGRVYPSWDAYFSLIQQAPYYNGWWDPNIESYYRADVRTNPDTTVQARSRPDAISAAADGLQAEDWRAHIAAIRQPVLLINAIGAYGPPGASPILTREQAMATVELLSNARYVEVPGNHMTMLYSNGARATVDAIASFVTGKQQAS